MLLGFRGDSLITCTADMIIVCCVILLQNFGD